LLIRGESLREKERKREREVSGGKAAKERQRNTRVAISGTVRRRREEVAIQTLSSKRVKNLS
jgi:hypothetical protein